MVLILLHVSNKGISNYINLREHITDYLLGTLQNYILFVTKFGKEYEIIFFVLKFWVFLKENYRHFRGT